MFLFQCIHSSIVYLVNIALINEKYKGGTPYALTYLHIKSNCVIIDKKDDLYGYKICDVECKQVCIMLPLEDIYRGGNSKSRNPHMQTMLRMVGFGDNAGSGFPSILATWKEEGWVKPELIENTALNQVTLYLKMILEYGEQSAEQSVEMQETLLSERQKQILACMELEVLHKTEEIAEKIGLKEPRTRQLLNELVPMG